MDKMTLMNTLVSFIIVFSLSDLVYYTGHRIVHRFPLLYRWIHKHHHGEPAPMRGWFGEMTVGGAGDNANGVVCRASI
jgi:sterol desaturase/sphingolipid hydroxylase (fatty acid hydroxylase superfamily)